jgi:hypothetical protein
MAKLIYIADNHDIHREAQEIELTFSDDLDIYEFKIVCQRMAAAMGYHHESIQRGFGSNEKFIKKEQSVSDLMGVISFNTGSKIEL